MWDVLKKMRSFGVCRLPVVNHRDGLEGILSVEDLIDLVAEELSDLRTLVGREQKRERENEALVLSEDPRRPESRVSKQRLERLITIEPPDRLRDHRRQIDDLEVSRGLV